MKNLLIQQLLKQLEDELESLKISTDVAAQAATHEESRPENKYDTRGLEASYLAGAQASRTLELQGAITQLRAMKLKIFDDETPITVSALVEVEHSNERTLYFLVPTGAGFLLAVDERPVLSITTSSPLGQSLLAKCVGESATITTPHGKKEFEIIGVR